MQPTSTTKLQALIGFGEGLRISLIASAGLVAVGLSSASILNLAPWLLLPSGLVIALGAFLSERAEANATAHKVLPHELDVQFYKNLGLPEEISRLAVADAMEEQREWESANEQPKKSFPKSNIILNSLLLLVCYILGGAIAMSSFSYIESPLSAFMVSCCLVIFLLFWISFFKCKQTGISLETEVLANILTTIGASVAVFGVCFLVVGW